VQSGCARKQQFGGGNSSIFMAHIRSSSQAHKHYASSLADASGANENCTAIKTWIDGTHLSSYNSKDMEMAKKTFKNLSVSRV